MTAVLTMPRMGETMESGRVAAWLKQPGDVFKRGEVILEIETDKTTVEMPALDDGRLVGISAAEGTEVEVGGVLGHYDAAKDTGKDADGNVMKPARDRTTPARVETEALQALTMPRMGETMEEGRVVAWLKEPGQHFKRGEVLLEIETDKTTVEVPALDDGRLVDVVAQAGATVVVGEPIGHYARKTAGPTQEATMGVPPPVAAAVADLSPAPAPEGSVAPVAMPSSCGTDVPSTGRAVTEVLTERPRVTPLARRLARTGGLDLAALTGTGRRARIEARDVEAALAARSPGNLTKARPPDQAPTHVSTPDVLVLERPDGRLAYRDWHPDVARGTVLFLHGFSADGATWSGFASALSRQGLRVVAPDLPGHAATTIEADTPDAMTAAVVALATKLDLRNFHLVAHSMGAVVAVRAMAETLRPARLTLIAPAGLGSEIDAGFVNGMARLGASGSLAHLLRRLARRVPPMSRPQLERMTADFARGRLKRLAANLVDDGRQAVDILADLQALSVPTQIIWGLEDRIIPWTHVAHVPSRMPVHLIAGAGHMPHWDNPQDLAALFT